MFTDAIHRTGHDKTLAFWDCFHEDLDSFLPWTKNSIGNFRVPAPDVVVNVDMFYTPSFSANSRPSVIFPEPVAPKMIIPLDILITSAQFTDKTFRHMRPVIFG